MKIEQSGNIIVIRGLSSNLQLLLTVGVWICTAIMLLIYFAFQAQPGDNAGPLFVLGCTLLLIGYATFIQTKIYWQSRTAGIRLNRATGEVKRQFGAKRLSRRLGKFRQITIYKVVNLSYRGSLTVYCAVLVGSQDKINICISALTLSGVKSHTKAICEFLNIDAVESEKVLHSSIFLKQFP